ncbi:MAG: hypothetical protein ACKOFI_09160, partial [Phycisphaerales bacterium]
MVTIRTTAAFAATIAVAALVAPAAAQAPAATGSVRGVVTDKEFGAPIAGAAVTVLGTRARVSTADQVEAAHGDRLVEDGRLRLEPPGRDDGGHGG